MKGMNLWQSYTAVSLKISLLVVFIIFNLRTAAFKAYCAIWVRHANFRHQASPRVSPHESTQRRKVELWARNIRKFCLNADLQVTNLVYNFVAKEPTLAMITSEEFAVAWLLSVPIVEARFWLRQI